MIASSSATRIGLHEKIRAMLVALVLWAPMYCGATATPMPNTASGSSVGRPRHSAWRCRSKAGAASGNRIRKAISQRPKARKTGGRAASWAQRAATMLEANSAGAARSMAVPDRPRPVLAGTAAA